MTYDIVLALKGSWYRLSKGTVNPIEPWSAQVGPTMLITDFDQAHVGIHRFDGKPSYAAAVIDKHVRAVGLAEGPSHIALHHTTQVADGCFSLYTAVAMETWQRTQQWAAEQVDHCLPMALGSLFLEGLMKGQARVTRLERTLHLCVYNDAGVFYASVSAVGNTADDFKIAIKALYAQSRTDLIKGILKPVQWVCMFSTSLEQEAALVATFSDLTKVECQLVALEKCLDAQGAVMYSAAPLLCRKMRLGAAQASWLARLAWRAESLMIPAAVLSAVAGTAFIVMAGLLHAQTATAMQQVKKISNEADSLEARVVAANAIETPSGFAPVAAFAQQLGDGATYDPVAMLQLVREAAGQDIRIQRLKLESFADKKRVFRVDGMTEKSGTSAITRFIAVTQAAGWQAQAIDPAEQLPGAFSYRFLATSP